MTVVDGSAGTRSNLSYPELRAGKGKHDPKNAPFRKIKNTEKLQWALRRTSFDASRLAARGDARAQTYSLHIRATERIYHAYHFGGASTTYLIGDAKIFSLIRTVFKAL